MASGASGDAPGIVTDGFCTVFVNGVIPSSPTVPSVSAVSDLSGVSRTNILRSAASLCSQSADLTLEAKVDNMTSLVGLLVQLLLIEQSSSSSGSPLSWTTLSSSNVVGGSTALAHCSHVVNGVSDISAGAGGVTTGAAKRFQCPVCPGSKRLTEKGFAKHVEAWRCRRTVRKKKPTCPGIASHPMFNGVARGEVTVDHVVDTTLKMLNPGANAAHGAGTGNHDKVQRYFSHLFGSK